jgi:hypothetical protein
VSRNLSTQEHESGGAELVTHVVRIRLPSVDSLIAVALVISVVSWRVWAVLQWTFQGDDWNYVAQATRVPFLQFITTQYNGHLLTGQFALVWVVSRTAPLNYAVAMAPLLVLTLVGGVLMWRFLISLFGDRPTNLIPLAVFMLCPLSVPPSLWWAAALTIVPLQLFIVATLFAVLSYVRDRSTWRLVWVGLVYAGAVIFWQKAVLILPITALFVLFFLGEGGGTNRLRNVSVGLWRLWAVLGGITVAYVSWYAAVAKGVVAGHPTLLQLERVVTKTLGSTIIPTYLGGPWSASPLGKAFVYELPLLPRVATWLAAGLIVAVSVLRYRCAWRAWTLLLVYIGMSTALVAVGRLPLIGAESGLGSRYYADSVAVFAVALALAFMVPLDRRSSPGWSPRVFPLGAGSRRRDWAPGQVRGQSRTTWAGADASRKFAVGMALAYAISALLTSFRMAGTAETYSARSWLETAKAGLEEHPAASVVDSFLPVRAAPPSLDQAKLSYALAPIAPHIRWNAPDEHPLIFDRLGRLWPVHVGSAAQADPGPVRGCGYRTSEGPVFIQLRRPLFFWTWGVMVTYNSNGEQMGSVAIDGDPQRVRFLRGPHTLILFHRGTARSVTIGTSKRPVCVSKIRLGLVKPALPSQ